MAKDENEDHLDDVIHNIKVEVRSLELDVDIDEILDRESFMKCIYTIEKYLEILKAAHGKA